MYSVLLLCVWILCFFFFKQKTAYEMRISDWSSDVCSSDLVAVVLAEGKVRVEEVEKAGNGTDMTPGRQLVITDRRWTMSNVDVKKETGWTEGRLIFMQDRKSVV